jgi:DNA/RNA endonuclease G (NUC1)
MLARLCTLAAITIASLCVAEKPSIKIQPPRIWTIHTGQAPTGAAESDVFVSTSLYALSLNGQTKVATWCGYRVTAASQSGRNSLNRNWIHLYPDLTLESSDYLHSGYAMGHLCPLASVRADADAFEVNWTGAVAPQRQSLNAGPWLRFEELSRKLAREHGVVFVLCGPLYETQTQPLAKADEPHVVPSHYWGRIHVPATDDVFCYVMPQECEQGAELAEFFVQPQECCFRSGLVLCHDRKCEVCDGCSGGESESADRDREADQGGVRQRAGENRIVEADPLSSLAGIVPFGHGWRECERTPGGFRCNSVIRMPLDRSWFRFERPADGAPRPLDHWREKTRERTHFWYQSRGQRGRSPYDLVAAMPSGDAMSNKIGVEITGGDDLDRLLSQLPLEMRMKAIPKALNSGAKVVQKVAKSKLPDPGYEGDKDPDVSLKREIKVKNKVYENGVVSVVGPTYRGAPHSHLVEFGHTITAKEVVDGVTYVTTYHGAARPYMRQSADETKPQQQSEIVGILKAEVSKIHKEYIS